LLCSPIHQDVSTNYSDKSINTINMKTFSSVCAVPFLFGALLKEGNAFSLKTTTTNPTTTTTTSRKDFFTQVASTMAVVSLGGVVLGAPTKSLAVDVNVGGKVRYGDEEVMVQKGHGTSKNPVQSDLLYGVDNRLADKITNFNRNFAENGGYFKSTTFEETVLQAKGEPITFYDSVSGKALFVAPVNRSAEDFISESKIHGWPSFRDEEVSC
jgi:hypothetical protein